MQRERNEWGNGKAEPEDGFAEELGDAIAVGQALELFHGEVASRNGKGKMGDVARVVLAALQALGNAACQHSEKGQRTAEPSNGEVPMSYRILDAENGRNGIRNLVHHEHADTGEQE